MTITHDCGCSQAVKDARTDDWGQIAPESAREATQEPRTASDGTPAAPDACAPVSGPLPRRIKPEDVRPGMVVDISDRVRITKVDEHRVWISDYEGTELHREGRSWWLIEDAPPVDPDAAAIEALVTAYRRSPECSTDSVFGEAMLDHLRAQGFDVTARAEL